MEKVDSKENGMEKIVTIFRVLSNLDALNILFLAGEGIDNSTHTMEELNMKNKKYYSRLNGLIESGLIKKIDGSYRQTPLGNIIYNRFLLSMERVCDAKDKLGLLEYLEGAQIENGVRMLIEDELKIPGFEGSPKVKLLESFEDLAIKVIDLYDSAEESVILASNYWDVRVMEVLFRSSERGVINRLLLGKKSLSTELKKLRAMLSITFAKTIINFASSTVNFKEFVRVVDLPYTFCVIDGQRSIIEVFDPVNERFMFALSIDDKGVAEKLAEFFEILWGTGEFNTMLKVFTSIGNKLKGETPHQDSEL